MDENLCVTVNSPGKLVIGHLGVLDINLMRDHEAGLGLSGNDQVTQVPVVRLDIALASADSETLDDA
jgi:hypothetical protein